MPVPNWSGTKYVTLSGCHLTSAPAASLSSLASLHLVNVSLSEQTLQSFLSNAPRLLTLYLDRIFGVDKLEVVSSPLILHLCLYDIYSDGTPELFRRSRHCFKKMRSVRISSPHLRSLNLCAGLEELEIDAPNLAILSWTVHSGDPFTKVNVINLASDCRCRAGVLSYRELNPQWLRQSLSTTFTQFHRLRLVSGFKFPPSPQQVSLELTHAECAFRPPKIDHVQYEPYWWGICDMEEAGGFLNHLFWVCRPKFVSIVNLNINLIAECMCQEYLKIKSTDAVNSAASWSRHLKDRKIENDTTGEMMEISRDVIPTLAKREKVKFMLVWC
ncbi:unnamed protein product [Linum tenue]|uniref:Uncharacterized protein n=1 Tax=Linum tenue TaxID=586396 RepID=A0AAV0PAV9_9ROSI|nr:unnamed protein product [Linum tenue]